MPRVRLFFHARDGIFSAARRDRISRHRFCGAVGVADSPLWLRRDLGSGDPHDDGDHRIGLRGLVPALREDALAAFGFEGSPAGSRGFSAARALIERPYSTDRPTERRRPTAKTPWRTASFESDPPGMPDVRL